MHWETVVEIDRPIEQVWHFVNEVFNTPRLRGSILVVHVRPPGPLRLGSTYQGRGVILGYEIGVRGEVTGWDPPREVVGSIAGSGIRSGWIRESLEPTPRGTRLTREMELELNSLLRIVWLLFGRLLSRRWDGASQNIKHLIEAAPEDAGPMAPATSSMVGASVRRTFLFSDIVGSTALVGLIGDAAWRDLRRWHDTTLRRLFDGHHGREVDHAGDGFLVAFDRAADAVACAIQVQRMLVEHRRSAGFAPAIRIGLHTGDARRDGLGFAGAAVHVAARVAESAEGGQILASSTTIEESQVTPAGPAQDSDLRGIAEPVPIAPIAW